MDKVDNEKTDCSEVVINRLCRCKVGTPIQYRNCVNFEDNHVNKYLPCKYRGWEGQCYFPIPEQKLSPDPYNSHPRELWIRQSDFRKMVQQYHWLLGRHCLPGPERDQIVVLLDEVLRQSLSLTEKYNIEITSTI